MRTFAALPALAALAPVALACMIACGGATPSDLLAGNEPSGTGSSSSGGGGGKNDASTGSDTSTSSQDDGSVGDEPGAADDAADNVPEAGNVADAREETTAPEAAAPRGVTCASGGQTTYCQNMDICCITTGLAANATCQAAGASCLGGTQVRCSSNANCASSEICCGTEQTLGFVTTYSQVTCATTCNGTTHLQFCDRSASGSDVGGCPMGKTCTPSTVIAGYSYCK